MNNLVLTIAALAGLLTLGGCVSVDPARPEPIYKPAYPRATPLVEASAGAIYQTGGALSLFDDRRASRVGDVVTILLQEQTSSSKSAETSIKKESETELPNPTLFGNLVRGSTEPLMNEIESESEFTGEAESDQSNSLSGTLSAVVAEVLPNGLMLVQGEKWLNLNRGEEYVRVSGLLRPEDIDASNRVSSLRLADARIAYSGTGELADSNRAGWLSRFFLNPIFPF
ncbi:MAG: flagellar basal body L-ring protein FlgH [Gammaproteobacteria bacterium]|nr:flagellar basal body L-ring protein FlgH [Gammaproteobacteria bacterium]